jgi:hypothetical protein
VANDDDTASIGHNGGPPLDHFLSIPQAKLIYSAKQYPAMVAGFGAGKTAALIERMIKLKFQYPKNNVAYYLPTFDLVKTIAYPRFVEALADYGLLEKIHYSYNKQDAVLDFSAMDAGKVIMRTMDNPARIIGYEVGHSGIDELDTLKTEDARDVWNKVIARNRQKLKVLVEGEWVVDEDALNTVAVGTTPEGFRFMYEQWEKDPPSDEYEIIRASTYSNEHNLPKGYIQGLIDAYPPGLVNAYIRGFFTNLTQGAVYFEFSRELNGSKAQVRPEEALHWGLDFNVGKMAAVAFVQRETFPHAVAEITGVLDTPAMILAIRRRFPGHAHIIYPDASGNARKSNNASVSDISLLQQAKFTVLSNNSNPAVKDRILSMNAMINSGKGRRLFVNADNCPSLVESLEKQAYDKHGEPDKASGLDHIVDAAGYFITYRYPIVRHGVHRVKVKGN